MSATLALIGTALELPLAISSLVAGSLEWLVESELSVLSELTTQNYSHLVATQKINSEVEVRIRQRVLCQNLMDTYSLTFPHGQLTKLTLNILVENEKEGSVSATVLGLPDCKAEGATKEEALASLSQLLKARLERTEIVPLEIEPSKSEHPWMKFAGMFKDDPHFDEVLADIEAYRRELDAEMKIRRYRGGIC